MVTIFVTLILAFLRWSILPLQKPALPISTTKILDRDGGLLYEVQGGETGKRTVVTLDQVSPIFIDVLLASEDRRFYTHQGVDWRAAFRAAKDILLRRKIVSGASTIEQQLIKVTYFRTQPRSFFQKGREMIGALYWSATHTKKDTLTQYVNTVFLGNQTYGVEAAAQTYFHLPASHLTFGQSALLVAMLPAPSVLDPYRAYPQVRKRQRIVLDRAVEAGRRSTADREGALQLRVEIFPPRHPMHAPHFVLHVLDDLAERYPDIREGGYTIKTTLDPYVQRVAEETIQRRLTYLTEQHATNGAFLALVPQTGEVLAYVGSRDYFNESIQGQVDIVTAKRQPGSALKPFLYMQAFMEGMTPATVIADAPVRFTTAEGRSYYPRNYGYRYYGPVSLREALGSSLNIPAVKVLDKMGLTSFVGFLSRFGIRFPDPPDYYGLGLVLGGAETSLWDVTAAYASLAMGAQSVTPQIIREVRGPSGNLLEGGGPVVHTALFDGSSRATQSVWLVTDILSDAGARARSFGEANLLDVGRRVAVKTGTTKDFRDNWAFGYTPQVAMGVWVGNADNTPMEGVSGITGAVPIWHDVMKEFLAHMPEGARPDPQDLVSRRVCTISGKLANGICPKTRSEWFISGTEPHELDDWYVRRDIDVATGGRVTPQCRTHIISKVFLEPPREYAAWIDTRGYERSPVKDCEGTFLDAKGTLSILSPLDGDTFAREGTLDAMHTSIPFAVGGTPRSLYHWTLNGQSFTSSDQTYLWQPHPGRYTLEVENGDRAIHFDVQ